MPSEQFRSQVTNQNTTKITTRALCMCCGAESYAPSSTALLIRHATGRHIGARDTLFVSSLSDQVHGTNSNELVMLQPTDVQLPLRITSNRRFVFQLLRLVKHAVVIFSKASSRLSKWMQSLMNALFSGLHTAAVALEEIVKLFWLGYRGAGWVFGLSMSHMSHTHVMMQSQRFHKEPEE